VALVPLYREASSGAVVAKLKAGTNVTITEATVAGALEVTVAASGGGGGGGAPTTASYVTLGTDATLTNERVLTAGSNITITDGGAGSTVTIAATVPTVPTAASTVVAETSYGQSSAVGTSTSYARADHTHGTPAAIAAASTVVAETSYGQASVVGTSTSYARADHTHGTPAVPAHTALSSLAWTAAGHTGSSTAVAAWNGGGTAAVVQATTDETMLVRRSGVLQWVPIVASVFFIKGGDIITDGKILVPNGIVVYTGSIL